MLANALVPLQSDAGGGAAVVLGGGYVGYTQFIAGPNDSAAESVVRSYLSAAFDGNEQEAASYAHTSANFNPSMFVSSGSSSASIDSLSEQEEPPAESGFSGAGESVTYVVAEVSGEGETATLVFQLRMQGEEWRIFDVGFQAQ